MKIAIISDIHGNHLALASVLTEAKRQGVELLFVLGDLVGYYYHADLVLDYLRCWSCEMIQGNHEALLRQASLGAEHASAITQQFGHGIVKSLGQLAVSDFGFLVNLPVVKDLDVDGVKFKLCHGSPWDRDLYIYPDSSRDLLDECLVSEVDFVFLGHTHYPFVYSRNETVLVNVGSVGQARNRGGVADWAIVDTSNKKLTLQCTPYDVSLLLAEARQFDSGNEYLVDVLLR